MAFNHYLKREKYKRQYTFTKGKAVVGFILSAIFSITMSAYFDRYGAVIFKQLRETVSDSAHTLAGIPQFKPKRLVDHEQQQLELR